jgi:hypothetical protein
MALYLVSYDIAENNHDYQPLWNRLVELNALQVMRSGWLLPKSEALVAGAIAVELMKFIGPTDSLFVQEVGNDASWRNLAADKEAILLILRECRF